MFLISHLSECTSTVNQCLCWKAVILQVLKVLYNVQREILISHESLSKFRVTRRRYLVWYRHRDV